MQYFRGFSTSSVGRRDYVTSKHGRLALSLFNYLHPLSSTEPSPSHPDFSCHPTQSLQMILHIPEGTFCADPPHGSCAFFSRGDHSPAGEPGEAAPGPAAKARLSYVPESHPHLQRGSDSGPCSPKLAGLLFSLGPHPLVPLEDKV